jgi:transposase
VDVVVAVDEKRATSAENGAVKSAMICHVVMAIRVHLNDLQWAKVSAFLLVERGAGRPGRNDRNFVEAVLWWRRTGIPWRDLPDNFGPWKTVFNRFDRWAKKGKWTKLFAALKTDVDAEWQSLDSTINRAHQHSAGGKGGQHSRPSADLVAA